MNKDLDIAQKATMQDIRKIADQLGLSEDDLELYGKYKAKINLDVFEKFNENKDGSVILVTAINPTKAGEGKSTTTVGLGQAFNKIGKNAIIALREPSFGPVMGIKGGAAGGGYSQVVPMEDINLHFTGDIHAISTANNAVSAIIDNHIHRGNALEIDPRRITWNRVLDMNDRALRGIVVGLGGTAGGIPREDQFDIAVASEIMAVLCLANNLEDLKTRIKRIVFGYTYKRKPLTIGDLGIEGAITLILKDAIKPNLVQTLENTPALIHGGPFANIAHGCNSIIATNMGRKLADYVITEAGFGADLGAEKFLDIKADQAGFTPSAVVIVATIRALKMHGGMSKKNLTEENIDALMKGTENLDKHIDTIKQFGLPYVVAINEFVTDTKTETDALANYLKNNGHPYSISRVWEKGGEGATDLAKQVINEIENKENKFKKMYEKDDSIKEKIEKIAKKVYGAKGVEFTKTARRKLRRFKRRGWEDLSVCMAKTQSSLSDNPRLLGRPTDFTITVRDLKPAIGAGFIVALTGDVMTMPGLPKRPAALDMDITKEGKVKGLF
ncbi:MAG: formate--tetrahydrofolate ligase [Candidatus Izimaplasma sp.]|nr:formate--tetrahydrofolate ligase [Candidatus Izimaplasma bacterium]